MTVGVSMVEALDAVLVIDMQNSFLHPDGAFYEVTGQPVCNISGIVEANVGLVAAARASQKPVIFTRHRFRPGYVDAGLMVADTYKAALGGALLAGSWDSEIIDELAPRPDEFVVDKARMDAFYNTDLELILRGYSATRIAVVGVVTNACVETTVRSAAMRDLAVTVISDCCGTFSHADQRNALDALARYGFAKVGTLSEVIGTSTPSP